MSSDIGVSNTGYTQVKDTVHGANVLSSLLDTGVFPGSFRVVKGYVNFGVAANASVGDGKAVLSSFDGVQILLASGDLIVHTSVVARTTITSAGSPTFDIGLAAAPGSAVTGPIVTAAQTMAAVNTGLGSIVPVRVSADQWISVDVNVAAVTGGILEVIIIIA